MSSARAAIAWRNRCYPLAGCGDVPCTILQVQSPHSLASKPSSSIWHGEGGSCELNTGKDWTL
ncbi:MAG TPA: hypothetical protein VNG51_01280 [Ktedonobacteraceae bacterium]|nr:hypothetical protein [Ktedonobacteraceae bacterium]